MEENEIIKIETVDSITNQPIDYVRDGSVVEKHIRVVESITREQAQSVVARWQAQLIYCQEQLQIAQAVLDLFPDAQEE